MSLSLCFCIFFSIIFLDFSLYKKSIDIMELYQQMLALSSLTLAGILHLNKSPACVFICLESLILSGGMNFFCMFLHLFLYSNALKKFSIPFVSFILLETVII